MKNVFAYTRVSTARQGTEGSSLTEQKSAIIRYADANQLRIVQWFEEQETAAKQGRPVFAKLFKQLSQGKATGVIIHKIDRSARNLRDWADLGELVDRGIEIHLAHESLDMTSRGGRLAADIQAVVAADYVRNLRQEVKKGIIGRLKQGLLPGNAPVGYLNQGGGRPKIPDPVKAPLIRRLFEMYASGRYSYDELRNEAWDMGLTTRNGQPIARNAFTAIFRNEFYIGVIHHKASGERYVGVHEPIIPNALFQSVQKALAQRSSYKVVVHEFAYRRLIRCVDCGHVLTGERVKGHVYYRCHTRPCAMKVLKEHVIDARFVEALATITIPSHALSALRSEIDALLEERVGSGEAMRQAKARQIAQLDQRLNSLTDRYLDGDIERDWYLGKRDALVSERALLTEHIGTMDGAGRAYWTKVERYFQRQKRLQKSLGSVSRAEIAELMKLTTSNVTIEGQSLLIDWKTEFREVQEFSGVQCRGAHIDEVRTSCARNSGFKRAAIRLFQYITADDEAESDAGPAP